MTSLPNRIRRVISDSKLTLPDFANRQGIGRSTIVSYRDGTTSPPIAFLEKMAAEFSISKRWMMLGDGDPHEAVDTSPDRHCADSNLVMEAIRITIPALQQSLNTLSVILLFSLPDSLKLDLIRSQADGEKR